VNGEVSPAVEDSHHLLYGEIRLGRLGRQRLSLAVARALFSMPESIATPCSVKANGRYFECSPCLNAPIWQLRI
jgi:hypothetical protein